MKANLSDNNEYIEDLGNKRIAIVVSTYHYDITQELLRGAEEVLKSNGIQKIEIIKVPGAYELIYGCQVAIKRMPDLDGIITLGCVIKGDTDHNVYINQAVSQALVSLQIQHEVPIGFGLLTVNNHQQAYDRSHGSVGNKGIEVAHAVLKCLNL